MKEKSQQHSPPVIDGRLREQLIHDYSHLVAFFARKIAKKLPSHVHLDDLISAGFIGLMDAIAKFDAARDNHFKTYAEYRIRGAILDELRAQDLVPRSLRDREKRLERERTNLEKRLGRKVASSELAESLGLSLIEFHKLFALVGALHDINRVSAYEGDRVGAEQLVARQGDVEANLEFQSVKASLAQSILTLTEKMRLVLSLYYHEGLNYKEIGRVLQVSESRVSQIHSQAVIQLRKILSPDVKPFS